MTLLLLLTPAAVLAARPPIPAGRIDPPAAGHVAHAQTGHTAHGRTGTARST